MANTLARFHGGIMQGPVAAFWEDTIVEIGDLVEARVVVNMADQTSINVRHFVVTAKVGTGATLAQIATALDAIVAPPYKSLLNIAATYRGIGCRRVEPLPPTPEVNTIANLGAGGVVGDALPRQTCGLLSLRTAVAGPRARGRFYVAFPGEADSDASGAPVAAYVTRLNNLATPFLVNLNAGAGGNTNVLAPVIWSRLGGSIEFITNILSRSKWATQRRRGSFGRPNPAPF